MINNPNKKIVLPDGEEFYGYSFGSLENKVAEIVFNTSMVGYQEIISDPSYTYQAVVMTYPLIGNYGMPKDDYESLNPSISALIVREYCDSPSNFRSVKTLESVMKEYNITGVSGIDTRKLTRCIRDHGSMAVAIVNADTPKEEALRLIETTPLPRDGVAKVSSPQITRYCVPDSKIHIVAIDCGIKLNIIRSMVNKGCSVTVVPWDTPASEIVKLSPDGVFISNGPGDPTDAVPAIEAIKALKGNYPIFGICLGHQIIALAYGAKTYKLKFGHRGGNHPVKDLATGKVEITSQNHSYAVDADSLKGTPLEVTHINLLDNTVEGLCSKQDRVFSVQYHPESAPGPEDSHYLFDRFLDMIKEDRHA